MVFVKDEEEDCRSIPKRRKTKSLADGVTSRRSRRLRASFVADASIRSVQDRGVVYALIPPRGRPGLVARPPSEHRRLRSGPLTDVHRRNRIDLDPEKSWEEWRKKCVG